MRRRWIHVRPSREDDVAAALASAVVAVGVGVVTFYLTRLFLAREEAPGRAELAPPDEPLRIGDGEA